MPGMVIGTGQSLLRNWKLCPVALAIPRPLCRPALSSSVSSRSCAKNSSQLPGPVSHLASMVEFPLTPDHSLSSPHWISLNTYLSNPSVWIMHLAHIWSSLAITLQSIYGSYLLTQETFAACLLWISKAGKWQTFVEALSVNKEPS